MKSQPDAFGGPTEAFPRYTAFLFCGKRECRLDIKVCIHHKCKKLKEKGGIFTCKYKTKAERFINCRLEVKATGQASRGNSPRLRKTYPTEVRKGNLNPISTV